MDLFDIFIEWKYQTYFLNIKKEKKKENDFIGILFLSHILVIFDTYIYPDHLCHLYEHKEMWVLEECRYIGL